MPSGSVTMFVLNSCQHDARVLKEAASLTTAGYAVRIVATLSKQAAPHEVLDGYVIDRVRTTALRRGLRRVKNAARRRTAKGFSCGGEAPRDRPITGQRRTRRTQPDASRRPAGAPARALPRAAGRAHGFLSRLVRSLFLPIYRPLCHLDYGIRAYQAARMAPSDIYHGHDLHGLAAAWWARRRLGGKLIYDSHEIYTEMSNLRWVERKAAIIVERFLIRRVDAVITIHDTAADELARRYGVPKPSVVRNCPRIPPRCERTTRLRDAVGLESNDLIVLYQGGFTANRGLANLLCAMPHLPERAKLVMMGWGKIEPDLRALAAELGLLDRRIFFLPPVPQSDLLYWTASADVGVIPYQAVGLNNYLCMPNKLFEYMGAGLPIVASAFPELSRIIHGNKVGLTFDPEDPKSIAEAVETILGDADLRSRMSENARKASLVYNWENEEKSLLEVYAKVAA